MDLCFALIRMGAWLLFTDQHPRPPTHVFSPPGLFYNDKDLIRRNIDKAESLLEQGGDWDR